MSLGKIFHPLAVSHVVAMARSQLIESWKAGVSSQCLTWAQEAYSQSQGTTIIFPTSHVGSKSWTILCWFLRPSAGFWSGSGAAGT